MTFLIRTRGSPTAPIAADYLCTACGPFETIVPRPAPDEIPCERCAAPATWLPCAPRIKHPLFVSCHRGRDDEKPFPEAMDTELIADGKMSTQEWREHRKKMWNDVAFKEWKREVG